MSQTINALDSFMATGSESEWPPTGIDPFELVEHRFKEVVGVYLPNPTGMAGRWERKRAREQIEVLILLHKYAKSWVRSSSTGPITGFWMSLEQHHPPIETWIRWQRNLGWKRSIHAPH